VNHNGHDTQPALLQRLRQGSDHLAWDEFFERYWRGLYGAARRHGCSEHTAEEIVQDVMLAVFESQDVFHYDPERGRFRDWLAALVRNKVAEYRRRPAQRVRAAGGDEQPLALVETESEETIPEQVWERTFEEALLVVLLDVVRREFSPRTFQAFELSAIQGMPGAEVARLTGQTRNAVYLARRKVTQRLEQLGASYRQRGELPARLKQALQSQPEPAVERSLTSRIVQSGRSR
jgi:RNA polymerase sigma-70 factor (ECF subfamily)